MIAFKRLFKALLSPNVMYESVLDIALDEYYKKGFRHILLDIDNTVVGLTNKQCSWEFEKWVRTAKDIGFKVIIVSNNIRWIRIYLIAKQLKCDGYYFAAKPLAFTGKMIKKDQQLSFKKTLVIGDQLLTDVIFGNVLGAYSILVDPIQRKSSDKKRAQYNLEDKLLKWIGLK